jgi:hypothetical protein
MDWERKNDSGGPVCLTRRWIPTFPQFFYGRLAGNSGNIFQTSDPSIFPSYKRSHLLLMLCFLYIPYLKLTYLQRQRHLGTLLPSFPFRFSPTTKAHLPYDQQLAAAIGEAIDAVRMMMQAAMQCCHYYPSRYWEQEQIKSALNIYPVTVTEKLLSVPICSIC